jgi:hypothetical protein
MFKFFQKQNRNDNLLGEVWILLLDIELPLFDATTGTQSSSAELKFFFSLSSSFNISHSRNTTASRSAITSSIEASSPLADSSPLTSGSPVSETPSEATSLTIPSSAELSSRISSWLVRSSFSSFSFSLDFLFFFCFPYINKTSKHKNIT